MLDTITNNPNLLS